MNYISTFSNHPIDLLTFRLIPDPTEQCGDPDIRGSCSCGVPYGTFTTQIDHSAHKIIGWSIHSYSPTSIILLIVKRTAKNITNWQHQDTSTHIFRVEVSWPNTQGRLLLGTSKNNHNMFTSCDTQLISSSNDFHCVVKSASYTRTGIKNRTVLLLFPVLILAGRFIPVGG